MKLSQCNGSEPIGYFQPAMRFFRYCKAFSVHMRVIRVRARNNVIPL
jgi:ribosomal protein S26